MLHWLQTMTMAMMVAMKYNYMRRIVRVKQWQLKSSKNTKNWNSNKRSVWKMAILKQHPGICLTKREREESCWFVYFYAWILSISFFENRKQFGAKITMEKRCQRILIIYGKGTLTPAICQSVLPKRLFRKSGSH